MNEDTTATVTTETIAPQIVEASTTLTTNEDAESRLAELEAQKQKAVEEAANYKLAYLKEKSKKQETFEDETEDERIERIVNQKIADTKIAQIDAEKEALLRKALKENKELKLAQMNRTTTPPAGMGTHSEGPTVQSTLVTPDQMSAFKAKGWTDKDIERYKKNLQKYGTR